MPFLEGGRVVLLCFVVVVTGWRSVRYFRQASGFFQWLSPHEIDLRAKVPNLEGFLNYDFNIQEYILSSLANSCCMKGYFIID